MSKYDALTNHLQHQKTGHYPINFNEIERIVDAKLPASAYKYPAWWSNNPSNNVMTGAWLRAGWESSNVDIPGQKLVFRRKTTPKEPATAKSAPSAPSTGGLSLTISGMSDGLVARLEAKARCQGKSVERLAHDLLVQHSILTITERLSMADQIRKQSPEMKDVDVPGMIRADRDRQPGA